MASLLSQHPLALRLVRVVCSHSATLALALTQGLELGARLGPLLATQSEEQVRLPPPPASYFYYRTR